MADPARHSAWRLLRQYFLTGIVALLPLAITLYVGYRIFTMFDALGRMLGVTVPGFGLLVTLLLITLFGLLVSNFLGQQFVALYEWIFARVPVLRTVYDAVKQIVNTFSDQRSGTFQSVVLVPYGGGGGRSFGFVVRNPTQEGKVAVFVPFSPPTGGLLVLYAPEDVEQVDFSVEEAMKIVLSGGTLLPNGNAGALPAVELDSKESGIE